MNNEIINYQEYLKSDYWKEIREKVYKRDNYKCKLCGSKENICVHHSTYDNLGNEILDDLITICKHCHNAFHKINPNISYKNYVLKNILIKEHLEKEEYIMFIKNHKDIFENITNDVLMNHYIYYEDLMQILKENINSNFDLYRFISTFLDYFNLVLIIKCSKDIILKYDLPNNINFNRYIIVTKDFFKNNSNKMIMSLNIFDIKTMNVKEIFQQII
jgi:hypothetical protein